MEYISLNNCVHGGLYKVSARNFSLGVYTGKEQGFIGIRHKFTMVFLDLEYHWDTGPPYGTVKPIEFLEHYSSHISISNSELLKWLQKKEEYYL